jgi:phosphate transport system permease protein
MPGPAKDQRVARALSRRRHRINSVVEVLCIIAMAIGLLFLASILFTLFWRGLGGLDLAVFTRMTLPPGSNRGLLNAIIGRLIQTTHGALIGSRSV